MVALVVKRTKAHERALRDLREARARIARDGAALLLRTNEAERLRSAVIELRQLASAWERQAEDSRKAVAKSEGIVNDFRRYLPAIQHHKVERNIANNEPNHVMLARELAMLRLLVSRGCSVSAAELDEFLAGEARRADEGSSDLTIAARQSLGGLVAH